MSLKYDVLVVGAGISGCIFAMSAARNGAKVLLVERKNEIAAPLRGGEAFCKPFFDLLAEEMPFLKTVPKWELSGTKMVLEKFEILNKEPKWLAYMLERRVFEKTLAIEAVKSGCEILLASTFRGFIYNKGLATAAIVDTPDGRKKITARVFVGADGYASKVRSVLGLKQFSKDLGTAIEIEMAGAKLSTEEYIQIFVGQVPGGYAYIFPKGGGRVATGVGMRPLIEAGKKKTPIEYFNLLKNEIPELHSQLQNAVALEIKGGCIDLEGPIAAVHKNILLVGDAANQSFAYVGEGILPGMVAAQIAGEAAAQYIKNNDLIILKNYEKDFLASEIGKEVLHTAEIKDAINFVLASNKSKEYKQFFTALLEMEIIDCSKAAVKETMKNNTVQELVELAKVKIKENNFSVEIIQR
ncbi:MAG: NAD(P)/FAD-dependent oxidoreductase [Candidatus ainarchaeum sp.]|nr:NAD(P)/FAD-dependent oxidoreductase [Candidatus ainarchaeum sp.]